MLTILDTTYELPDQVSDNGAGAKAIETEANLYWLLKRLPDNERRVVELALQGRTQREIAEELGTYPMDINRILKKCYKYIDTC